MTEQSNNTTAGRGPRSPGYPAVTLEKALERARFLKVYSPGRKPIPVDTVLAQWKYSPGSGAGLQLLASLKKLGLLTDSGKKDQRAVQLTNLAWKILTDPRPDSQERRAAIQKAATEPTIHREILDRWPHGLPDDTTMHVWLVQEKAFNEKAVRGFLSKLRATFEYAKLDSEPHTSNNNGGDTTLLNQPKVGDYVQWTSQGAVQFRKPRRVVNIDEKDGEGFVMVSGARGAIPSSEVEVIQGYTPPPFEQTLAEGLSRIDSSQPGMKTEVITIGPHQASLAWPARLTQNEYDDLKYWLDGVLLKAQRDIGLGNTRSDAAVAHDEDDNAPAE